MTPKLGVTLILPDCAFSAELDRASITEMMRDIDAQLTAQKAAKDCRTRCDLMVGNGLVIGTMLSNNEIDHESGIADIAYSFVYVFGKPMNFDFTRISGLVGSYMDNRLTLNPCLDRAEYDRETQQLYTQIPEWAENETLKGTSITLQ